MVNDKLYRVVFTIALMLLVFCVIGLFIVEKSSAEYVVLILSTIVNVGITFVIIVVLYVNKKKR